MSGVHIRRVSIAAAGSDIVEDIESYSILVGNPAKVASHRFTEN